AVGQTGDLRPMYYQFKRNALFARSFEDILENSNATHEYDHIAQERGLSVIARASDKGAIISLDNSNAAESSTTYVTIGGRSYPCAGKLVLDPMEIMPLVHGVSLTGNVTMDWAIARVLGIQKTEHTTTVVVYGKTGSYGNILFIAKGPVTLQSNPAAFDTTGGQLALQLAFSGDKPNVYSFHAGNGLIRVVAVDAVQADRTWLVDENGVTAVVVGPEYIGNIRKEQGQLHLVCERPWFPAAPPSAYTWVYDDAGEQQLSNGPAPAQRVDQLAFTGNWAARDASAPAAKNYNDQAWLASKTPLQMGADADTSAYAWYRTTVRLPASGLYSLDISKGHGRYILFLDGKKAAEGNGGVLSFTAGKGAHILAVFSTHDGRDKLVSYIGKLDVDIKGIAGPVTLHRGAIPFLAKWKFLPAGDPDHIPSSYQNAVDYRAGSDAFAGKKGEGWFHTTIPVTGAAPDAIAFEGVDDNAVVYINGQKAGEQHGWGIPFSVPFPKAVKADSSTIDVFVSNDAGRGGLDAKIKAVYHGDQSLTGWRMKGGPGSFGESLPAIATPGKHTNTGSPVFYKNYFKADDLSGNSHPMWRVTFEGLSHGFIWLNGHNLGRYPEVIPIDGLYIPECWLNEGRNEVVIFDEYGNSPAAVKIQAEQAASRYVYDVR
ncbi:MAG TPA: hypothetical protein VGC22_11170, partial [Chitinophaga sp.]